MNSPFSVKEYVVDSQYIREYPRSTSTQDAPLKLAVKKYTPTNNPSPKPGDVTIIGAQGTGFPKELYEPLWEEILSRSEQDGFRIRAIWVADNVNQGVSGIHNEEYLGNDPSWLDHSRDLLHIINHFRDDMPRPIMGIGHSFGAAQLIFLSLIHARLFTSLILLEPYIVGTSLQAYGPALVLMTAKKKDVWASRAAATAWSQKHLKTWDPRVLDRWLYHGLRELPTTIYPLDKEGGNETPVTLTTTKQQEVLSYIRPNFNRHKELGLPDDQDDNTVDGPSPPHDAIFVPDMIGGLYRGQRFYRPEPILAWRLLPYVRPPVLYVSADKSGLFLSGYSERAATKTGIGFSGSGGTRYDRVKHVVVQNAGHMLPFENVARAAVPIGSRIGYELKRWELDEKQIATGWEGLSVKEKSTYSDEWKAAMNTSPNPLANKRGSKL